MQYVNLKNSTAFFKHRIKLAKSVMEVFSPITYISTISGKNENKSIELFRILCLDTTEIYP